MDSHIYDDILAGWRAVHNKKSPEVTVRPLQDSSETKWQHQPELTSDPRVNFPIVLEYLLKTLDSKQMKIGAIRIIGGDYMEKTGLITSHYGVIASISRNGITALSPQAKESLEKRFADEIHSDYTILGGHQLLKKNSQLTPYLLGVLNENLMNERIGPGSYVTKLKIDGKRMLILNIFHPSQVLPYCTSGNSIIVMEVLTDQPWNVMRHDIAGVTDPNTAMIGSIRKTFAMRLSEFGIPEVNKSKNCIHLSAGPLEGMIEIQRFFKISLENTYFGRLFLSQHNSKKLKSFSSNPMIHIENNKVRAFDATEEIDSNAAVLILTRQ